MTSWPAADGRRAKELEAKNGCLLVQRKGVWDCWACRSGCPSVVDGKLKPVEH